MPLNGFEVACARGFPSDFAEFRGRVTGSGLAEDAWDVAGRTSLVAGAAFADRLVPPFVVAGWTDGAVLGTVVVDVIPLGAGRV